MGIIVKLEDGHAVRYCNRGMRKLAANLGIDFDSFRKNGIDSDLLPQDDSMVQRAIARAKIRIANEDLTGG